MTVVFPVELTHERQHINIQLYSDMEYIFQTANMLFLLHLQPVATFSISME